MPAAFAALGSQGLFSQPTTTVLLAGLPGDTESENAYREQLQAWLGILASQPQPQRVFVLCDQPEHLNASPLPQLKTIAATRSNFLELNSLLETTNAVVVVAFGHGGKQGATPVLHVRGPRLTPGDFASVASKLQQTPSRWILMFRGSGAFARTLAGAGREILSSECETSFTSDPIGMGVLLKIVRTNPTIPFEDLSAATGKAVAEWYSSRNLARTEEPTLWVESSKPRLLAVSGDKPGQSGDNSSATPGAEPKLESQVVRRQEDEQHEPASAEIPAGWKDVKPVNGLEYPDADGVVLRRAVRCVIGSNPVVSTEQDEYIQVLSTEGKALGDFDVSYSPPEEDIEFLDCEVRRADGHLVRLDPDVIGESQEAPAGDYQAGKRKFFSLPGVGPGAVLHVHYRTQWREFPLPHVAMALPIPQEMPVLDSTIEISVPNDTPFHFLFEGIAAPDPAIARTGYSTSYRWHFGQQAERRREVLSSPDHTARLLFSTFSNWQAFAEWYGRISRLADEVTPEITAKAQELARNARSDREKVQAIYNYVSAMRYVAIPLGVNSLRPHAAVNVLKHQFGDCKDKANLLNALLHALDIKAQLVLVPRFTHAYDLVPGVGFNHAISRLDLEGKTLWVDTTDDVCRFGLLPPGDPGRKVLVVDGEPAALTQLPEPEPSDHQLKLTGEVQSVADQQDWTVRLAAQAQGYPDYELREIAREAKDKFTGTPLLAARFRPANGTFALDRQSSISVSAMLEDFSWRAEGTFVGLSSVASGKQLLRAPIWLPKEWDSALHQRATPLFLNQGYPLTLDELFEIQLPRGLPVTDLPPCRENNDPPLRWRIEWARVGHDRLAPHFHAQLVRGELSMAETTVLQKQLRRLVEALGESACFSLSPKL